MDEQQPKYTHILLVYKSQDCEILFRFDDGVCIGQRKGMTIVYGEEPNKKTSRTFFDQEYAKKFLNVKIPTDDLKARDIDLTENPVLFDIRDGEKLVVLPADSMEIPGGMTNFH